MGKMDLTGPKPLRYYHDPIQRLNCRRLPDHGPWRFWEVWFEGAYMGEVFSGKSGRWYALLNDGSTLRAKKWRTLGLCLVGRFLGPQ